ncbi:type II toxin-antitoxin system RelE/ParE family toxin [Candidatus Nomurabacteria bacterium]|nr:type II toxin-antitoxin system RelE/ParE family toxin [Candidatus Nomurabacteria bacterium]
MNRVKFLIDDIQVFLLSFDDKTVARILNSLELLDELGEQIRPPRSKKIAKNIYELRIISNLSVRILYTFDKDNIWILHAFVKKSQKMPKKELEKAIHRLKHLHQDSIYAII